MAISGQRARGIRKLGSEAISLKRTRANCACSRATSSCLVRIATHARLERAIA